MKKPTPFGKYFLLERINVGGMAEVFRAKAFGVEGFERLVAVKRILANIAEDKEFIRMFIDEAKLAVQLNHANIAQIFDLGVVDGSYYIALEHVHGRDLRAIFDRCRQLGEPMSVSQACFIVMKVCEGLDYAHNKRDQSGRELHLVHRDVSPQNMLVSFEGEVKIIDFGIAKAAGKGSKTQAGILKGKFGYMSPEQVRGIPIDRRSDVFSCGIVLYEMLTGERLFVGESDFSTLEKVRNVEILPPSTYNRRIPDELERIVLKALAKDPEERYQNAIDLHDELQAFVYTAGEFYSRKDLAGWMKKTFGREIEEESTKLESYRQLKPPPELQASARASGTRPPVPAPQTTPIRKSTEGMRAVSSPSKPPPPPPSPPGSARGSGPVPTAAATKPKNEDSLTWDEDELETQIYDDPNDPKTERQRASKLPLPAEPETPPAVARTTTQNPPPVVPRTTTQNPAAVPPPPPAPPLSPAHTGPDLSSLVSAAKGWEPTSPGNPTGPTATLRGMVKPTTNGANGAAAFGSPASAVEPEDDNPLAAREVVSPRLNADSLFEQASGASYGASPSYGAGASFGAGTSFGANMLKRDTRSSRAPLLAIGGAAVAVVIVVIVIASTGGKKTPSATAGAAGTSAPTPVEGDGSTGFDLYVSPTNISTWRLDDAVRTDRLPARIRKVTPGPHRVAIDAPAGYRAVTKTVNVEAGQAPKVTITLDPIVVNAQFDSTPEGAAVSLIVDGKKQAIGFAPAKAQLDPQKQYAVLFEHPGYVSKNQPVTFNGGDTEQVAVTMQSTNAPAVAPAQPAGAQGPVTSPTQTAPTPPPTPTPTPKVETPRPVVHVEPKAAPTPKVETPKAETVKAETPKATPAVASTGDGDGAKGQGFLKINAKPPCEILIDGSDSGAHTPQLKLAIPAGPHTITLKNDEYGISETFKVVIKPDLVDTEMKNYMDKVPQPASP